MTRLPRAGRRPRGTPLNRCRVHVEGIANCAKLAADVLQVALLLRISLVNKHAAPAGPGPAGRWLTLLALAVGSSGLAPLMAQEHFPLEPVIAGASDEGQQAIASFSFPANLVCQLFAAEPMLANPVALDVDFQGRVFVCESFRQERGVEDNRSHPEWLDDDLAAESVVDRVNYIKKHMGQGIIRYREQDDRIRLLLDQNHDGIADFQSVFAEHFNEIAAGTGAGVLSYRDRVYFTCIPDLWLLEDRDGDHRAEIRESLHRGFGVRFAFRGHDMHGLVVGPDGRLYFSIGDRGYNVSPEIRDPSSGAVFRCEPDGSRLEVVATGLRNPQELAFDNFGNLFTGDNNSDSGDRARWVFVVPGGDSGWRMHYQYLPDRGPFNREKIWHPYHDETPAWIVPPIANIADGPSGLAFYPGTGFGDEFRDRFFLCDFRGTAAISGIRSFRNQPVGAFWTVTDMEQTIWGTLATDVHFGSDGRLYVADWVFGWVGENKGRIYTWRDPDRVNTPLVRTTQQLLAGQIGSADNPFLESLLEHADRRVRQEAQFEMVRRNLEPALCRIAERHQSQMARLHAIWGLAQLARYRQQDPSPAAVVPLPSGDFFQLVCGLLADSDPEIRAQAIGLGAELANPELVSPIAGLLQDDNLRVRYFACMALARAGGIEHLPRVCAVLVDNHDQDPIVRHGAIMMMAGIARRDAEAFEQLVNLSRHAEPAVRIAAAVALRKLGSPRIAEFLHDSDPRVVLESARAIYDVPIDEALPALAGLIDTVPAPDAVMRRVINANLRLGGNAGARALAQFAANEHAAAERRIEALEILGSWDQPAPRDRVLGAWRPFSKRARRPAQNALAEYWPQLLQASSEPVVKQTVIAAGRLQLESAARELKALALDPAAGNELRQAAFVSLTQTGSDSLPQLLEQLVRSLDQLPDHFAAAVIEVLAQSDPQRALPHLRQILQPGSDHDFVGQQRALVTLGKMNDGASAELLIELIERATLGQLPAEVRLDLLLAAESRNDPALDGHVDEYRLRHQDPNNRMTVFADVLAGGNGERGRKVFFEKTEVSCVRCHRIGEVGGQVGPDLSTIGQQKDRRYILESIVEPNRTITEGFAQSVIMTDDGLMHTGLVTAQTDTSLSLLDADGNTRTIDIETIEDRKTGLSSMPVDLSEKLTRFELRDLVEFLQQQGQNPPGSK